MIHLRNIFQNQHQPKLRLSNVKGLKLKQRKVYCRAEQHQEQGGGVGLVRELMFWKPPRLPEGFQQSIFLKARWGRGGIGCCKLLGIGILCFCSCPHRSGHDVPVNLRSNAILCSETFYLCMNGKVFYSRWSQPCKWYVLYISGSILNSEQKRWNTKVTV